MLFPGQFQWAEPTGIHLGNTLDEWIDNVDWLNHDTVNWVSHHFELMIGHLLTTVRA
jgi:hypothetical protein